jgi:hypothetical protein
MKKILSKTSQKVEKLENFSQESDKKFMMFQNVADDLKR